MGRPAKYQTDTQITEKAFEFFERCLNAKELPEKAGLCLHLGISRDTYSEYRKKYPDTIKALDQYIESCWVKRLAGANATGAIFYLKNAFKEEYKDRIETDHTTKGKELPSPIMQLNVLPNHRNEQDSEPIEED